MVVVADRPVMVGVAAIPAVWMAVAVVAATHREAGAVPEEMATRQVVQTGPP